MEKMENNERYEAAKKRVKDIKAFYGHFSIYVVVMVFLLIIDLVSAGKWWVYWPVLGWGIAVAVHAVSVFGNLWGRDWEERKTRELMDKDKQMKERQRR